MVTIQNLEQNMILLKSLGHLNLHVIKFNCESVRNAVCVFMVLPSSGCKALQFFKDTHSISGSLNNICLSENILGKDLHI